MRTFPTCDGFLHVPFHSEVRERVDTRKTLVGVHASELLRYSLLISRRGRTRDKTSIREPGSITLPTGGVSSATREVPLFCAETSA